jgi:hypothetical protein
MGRTMPPHQLWDLAVRWYDDRLDLVWARKPLDDRQQILTDVGLTDGFWEL